ncbi:Cell division protein FtsK [Planctomycetales bacterium 10988]|nr:Cell division protein FtsK [Planctomycetales bacterium 10988]
MAEPIIEQQRKVLRNLTSLFEERSQFEKEVEGSYGKQSSGSEKEFHQRLADENERFEKIYNDVEKRIASQRERIDSDFQKEKKKAQEAYQARKERAETRLEEDIKKLETEAKEARWEATTLFEANKDKPKAQYEEFKKKLDDKLVILQALHEQAKRYLKSCFQTEAINEIPLPPPQTQSDPALAEAAFSQNLSQAEKQLAQLQKVPAANVFRGGQFIGIYLLLAMILILPSIMVVGWESFLWIPLSLAGSFLVGTATLYLLYSQASRRVREEYAPLCQFVSTGLELHRLAILYAATRSEKASLEMMREYEAEVSKVDIKLEKELPEIKKKRETDLDTLEIAHRKKVKERAKRHDLDLDEHEDQAKEKLKKVKRDHDEVLKEIHEEYFLSLGESKQSRQSGWEMIVDKWTNGTKESFTELDRIRELCDGLFLPWEDPSWEEWKPNEKVPPGIRFGEMKINLETFPGGLSQDPRLRINRESEFIFPAMLSYPNYGSLLLKARGEGRNKAINVLQQIMLRLLTAIPPGKVRFTIIDPVGLGENFAAFMHLADYNDQLVNNRIWTETQHIERRLIDLTEHMENVIQKYLRSEFDSIDAYNEHAGEIAEPYRVLVIANLPVNFTEAAARRLISVANSGARCGVYTLIAADMDENPVAGLNLADLENNCLTLEWDHTQFRWVDPDLGRFPLKLDEAPSNDFMIRVLNQVGESARDANRVVVPFRSIAPTEENFWKKDSRKGIQVPLGRSGANKRQMLELGKGTSHHALIAGKTGSGKSTLMHALITNVSLLYSPNEVELYLIDFKKGVEFKTYAKHRLPHAKVVAVESEREFGLSVLQRLDQELKRRGDLFRQSDVQDVAAFRDANPNEVMPRVMLIVDEFQEFFVEDDRLAQEASLLLDRLVRQGRAFGIHLIFGSQTLGGSFSLAKSTIGQMTVRIALQCSESDAHLILSDENPAARLLSRPGEAIYNDANGLVEGNNLFQVVWLEDDLREEYLTKLHDKAEKSDLELPHQIVFEGNVPARLDNYRHLMNLLEKPAWGSDPKMAYSWMGEAIAIKEPTAAEFPAQSGSNLIVIGQQSEVALGIFSSALISLAAQFAPAESLESSQGAMFYFLDGTPPDSAYNGEIASWQELVPHPLNLVRKRELVDVLNQLRMEKDRRVKENLTQAASVYLFIHDLGRFRDLRKDEDDFSFSSPDPEEEVKASKCLQELLEEGPNVRMHVMVWCDTLNNVNRCLDRKMQREFEQRVLFQMSANDSSTLIDTPAASKLGMQRALLYSEEKNVLEKFRPYSLPTAELRERIRELLQRRIEAAS